MQLIARLNTAVTETKMGKATCSPYNTAAFLPTARSPLQGLQQTRRLVFRCLSLPSVEGEPHFSSQKHLGYNCSLGCSGWKGVDYSSDSSLCPSKVKCVMTNSPKCKLLKKKKKNTCSHFPFFLFVRSKSPMLHWHLSFRNHGSPLSSDKPQKALLYADKSGEN